jgi:hypothetical protein
MGHRHVGPEILWTINRTIGSWIREEKVIYLNEESRDRVSAWETNPECVVIAMHTIFIDP